MSSDTITVPAQPIDTVLEKLDKIVDWSVANKSRAGYFAALYRRVTQTIKSQIGKNFFDDDARMEKLDYIFAGRYITAFNQWRDDDPAISRVWKVAFDAVDERRYIIIQQLLVGMNAHINFDLGIAAAQVAPTKKQLDSLHDDFNRINCILACLVPTVFNEIGALSPMIHLLEQIDEPGEEQLVDIVMNVARFFAWMTANELVLLNDVDPGLIDDFLAWKDKETSWIGSKVLDPGATLNAVVRVIWVPESKDVVKNIEVLAAPAALPPSCIDGCKQGGRQ